MESYKDQCVDIKAVIQAVQFTQTESGRTDAYMSKAIISQHHLCILLNRRASGTTLGANNILMWEISI